MLYAYLEALEDTANDLLVKEELFGSTDDRTLRECITVLDESEALDMISQAIIDLMLGDEVADSMLGVYDPLSSSDIDSSLNCSISEVKVPKEFAASNDKAEDLSNIVENELRDKGFNVTIKQIARPNATTIRVGFEGEADVSEVDRAIEEIITQLTKDSLFNS